MSQTTISLTEALKDHLRDIAGSESVDGVSTLHEALLHILKNPYEDTIEIDGYDETLNDPIKVPDETLDEVKALRDKLDARDYEEAIRERANIAHRDVGEEPVEVSDW